MKYRFLLFLIAFWSFSCQTIEQNNKKDSKTLQSDSVINFKLVDNIELAYVSFFEKGKKTKLNVYFVERSEDLLEKFTPKEQFVYEYDAQGDITKVFNNEFDENERIFYSKSLTELTYKNHKKIEEVLKEKEYDDFVSKSKYKYTYDRRNNISSKEVYDIDKEVSRPKYKQKYTYDSYNNVKETIDLLPAGDTLWREYKRYIKDYTDTLVIRELEFLYLDNQWVMNNKYENSYNLKNQLISKTVYRYYPETQMWKNDVKVNFFYDSNQEISTTESFLWNDNSKSWDKVD